MELQFTIPQKRPFEKRDPKTRWGYLVKVDCPFGAEEIEKEENSFFTTETSITQFFKKKKDNMIYIYDFGDNWEHDHFDPKEIVFVDPKKRFDQSWN